MEEAVEALQQLRVRSKLGVMPVPFIADLLVAMAVPAAATDHRVRTVATVSGVDLDRIYREGPDSSQDPAVMQSMLDQAAATRTAEANRCRTTGCHREQPLRSFEKANEPKGTFWIKGASHVDLYVKPPYVTPAVEKLAEFFGTNLKKQLSGIISLSLIRSLYLLESAQPHAYPRIERSGSEAARSQRRKPLSVNRLQELGRVDGFKLGVSELNSFVFSLTTTVRPTTKHLRVMQSITLSKA